MIECIKKTCQENTYIKINRIDGKWSGQRSFQESFSVLHRIIILLILYKNFEMIQWICLRFIYFSFLMFTWL
ncbi:hypothetical protein GDO81_007376 [Engystomops pustulosus]|uniref:Uncharacterized protein n=1 Tax=Engystomops pustulosus TaxID=76066 RepID=A0AAV7C7N5_ENGPU|nr:hypothetical protein GDO81_007376 [Engystomops pustulosus]